MEEMAKGEGGGQRPPGEDLAAQFFMHPGQHGASVRPCEPERGEPPGLAPRVRAGQGEEGARPGPGGHSGVPGNQGHSA